MCRRLPAETANFVFVQPARANGFWQEITDAYQATENKILSIALHCAAGGTGLGVLPQFLPIVKFWLAALPDSSLARWSAGRVLQIG
jgi:hypothetical protein